MPRRPKELKRFLCRCSACQFEIWLERDPRATKFRTYCTACGSIAMDIIRDVWAEIATAKELAAKEAERAAEEAAAKALET